MLEKGCIVSLRKDIKDSYLKYCTMQIIQIMVHKCGYYQVKCKIIKNKKYTIKNKWINNDDDDCFHSVQSPFTIEKNELIGTELIIATDFLE